VYWFWFLEIQLHEAKLITTMTRDLMPYFINLHERVLYLLTYKLIILRMRSFLICFLQLSFRVCYQFS